MSMIITGNCFEDFRVGQEFPGERGQSRPSSGDSDGRRDPADGVDCGHLPERVDDRQAIAASVVALWGFLGRAAELGQSRVELPVGYDGPSLSITLDPRYMNDFLKVLDPEKTFSLELKDSESAAVCHTDDGYGYVIMPLARDR